MRSFREVIEQCSETLDDTAEGHKKAVSFHRRRLRKIRALQAQLVAMKHGIPVEIVPPKDEEEKATHGQGILDDQTQRSPDQD